MIITIDGPSGTGKSTVAKKLADVLGATYFDTGALYRAIAWKILKDKIPLSDLKGIEKMLKTFSFDARTVKGIKRYYVGKSDVTESIRSPEVTSIVSEISALKCVRDAMRPIQEAFVREDSVVFEGRDLGTIVFPKADVKFFLTARPEIRAKRRLEDLEQKFPERTAEFSYDQILKEIEQRDTHDSTREIAPLKQAEDAILVDTSDLKIKDVVGALVEHVGRKMKIKQKPAFIYNLIIFLVRFFFKFFYRHRVYGQEHFISGGAIIAANHVSFFDPPIIAISSPEEIHFLARDTLFRSYFGKLIAKLNSHPVQGGMNNLRVIKTICGLLKEGKKVLIFPEGRRSSDNVIAPVKPGIGFLISKSESAIIPTYVHGTYEVWNRRRKLPRLFGRTAVIFGTPIFWKDYTDMDRKEAQEDIAMRLTRSLEELRKWYDSGAEGIPP